MTKTVTSLDDKYRQEGGRVFMSSNQALVRLPLDQARRDRRAGLKTAGYISGYRGSPLGVYDAALWGAQALLDEHDIHFVAGLNEELAATAIRGTQEIGWFGQSAYEGIFGLWYGKGLGVDRACESLKLGNLEGSSANGGFLVVAGDDHGGKSSASAHQSEHTLIAGFMPILYPSTTQEILEYGIYGWQMSRYTGLYVAMKCITDTLDISASVDLADPYRRFATPDRKLPPQGLNLRLALQPLVQEEMVVRHRLPAAAAWVRANPIDRTPIDGTLRTLGIVTAGKAYLDVRQALVDLGLTEDRCRALGIRVYKAGLIWPLEREGLIDFAAGHRALIVVEEKRPVMEEQIASILYSINAEQRPALLGKRDLSGAELLPSLGELSAGIVRHAIAKALAVTGAGDGEIGRHEEAWQATEAQRRSVGGPRHRPAFFCSGCPHNTGTRIPDGSIAISAVGCHGLAAYVMPERRTLPPMPMGGDGMPWVAVSRFVEMPHLFQNMGDGTYSHSGLLAIRAAVAEKTNVTFKILYNDAVAMTGGQPVEAKLSPIDVVKQLVAEGVWPVKLMSDEPEKYRGADLPPGVTIHDREELDEIQRQLREVPGVTGLVYDQTCATEKRRRRKRGTFPDPDKRVFINADVCEGCGDCSVQSNCISVQPLETEFGRKRTIDQSNCNKDFSCLKGFCPSFVTVEGATIATRTGGNDDARLDEMLAALPPAAKRPLDEAGYNLLVTGIGGTGVLTVGALIGMAAHLDRLGCSVLDMTGMAQKGGAVTSHIRIGPDPAAIHTSRIGTGMADVVIGCDMIVTSGADVLKTFRLDATTAVVNRDVAPTGDFQTNRNLDLGEDQMEAAVQAAIGAGPLHLLDATRLAVGLIGDSIATNLLMVGYALQKGLLPVSVEALEEAIRLNGAFVKGNLRTLALGRLAAHAPDALLRMRAENEVPALDTIDAVVESRRRLLESYQSAAYARIYLDFIAQVREEVDSKQLAGSDLLVREVALALARLMAYKDEYEVARLYSDPKFWARLRQQFSGDFKLTFHLAPPMLPGNDRSGRPRKRGFGPWMKPVFGALARMKSLRGTPFDPFGYTGERRMERRLIVEYRELVLSLVPSLDRTNLDSAIGLAGAASEIRGYGPVKEASVAEYRVRLASLKQQFEQPGGEAVALAKPTRVAETVS